MVHVLNVLPGHAMDTADGGVCQDVKGGGREVEGSGDLASTAAVGNGNGDRLALVCKEEMKCEPSARAPKIAQSTYSER